MAAVTGVTYGFGWELSDLPPKPEVTPTGHLLRHHPHTPNRRGTEGLLSVLESAPDPRDRRGVRYPLAGMLTLSVTAVVAGARSFAAIGQWAAGTIVEHLAVFGLTRASAPDESTLRKLSVRLDADALDRAVGRWMWSRTCTADGRLVIALDDETVRGARSRPDGKAPHLISGFDHAARVVLGQVAIDAKSTEIPAARQLLAGLDLDAVTVMMDAMHTQTGTAELILASSGDYVFTVKCNMRTLRGKLKSLPWNRVPATRQVTAGRAQLVTRTIKVLQVPDWIDFPGAAQVAQLRRTVTRAGHRTVEVVYLITSAGHQAAPPATLAAWVQGHWCIGTTNFTYSSHAVCPSRYRGRAVGMTPFTSAGETGSRREPATR